MHQVTLGGPAIQSFPSGQEGGYIKLLLKRPGLLSKPLMRTYTIRAQRDDEIDVQFALHGVHAAGPATQWALDAEPGDEILVGGPGPAKPFADSHDFYLIAGDMSALPAISANLEALPKTAKGIAVLEIQNEADAIAIEAPEGVELHWLINPEPGTKPHLLADALRTAQLPSGNVAGWAACEFSSMKELRKYLLDDLGIGPRSLYISSYWKLGLDESEHKKVKSRDTVSTG